MLIKMSVYFPPNMKRSLQEVIKHLSHASEVKAIFTTGTTASGLGPTSDIDLVVILDKNTSGLKSAYTMIENRFADVFFFDLEFVKKVAELKTIPANAFEGMFLTWLAKGKIEKDETGFLSELKTKSVTLLDSLNISFEEKQDSWFKINYNFIANQRYFRSEESVYHNALEIRLLYSVAELIVAYFTLRGIPWRGEKEAVKYLEGNDKSVFEQFTKYTNSQSLADRFHQYENLFKAVLHGEFQQWDEAFLFAKNEKNQLEEKLIKYVQELFGE